MKMKWNSYCDCCCENVGCCCCWLLLLLVVVVVGCCCCVLLLLLLLLLLLVVVKMLVVVDVDVGTNTLRYNVNCPLPQQIGKLKKSPNKESSHIIVVPLISWLYSTPWLLFASVSWEWKGKNQPPELEVWSTHSQLGSCQGLRLASRSLGCIWCCDWWAMCWWIWIDGLTIVSGRLLCSGFKSLMISNKNWVNLLLFTVPSK